MSSGKFALGALIGAAVGFATGILTAPKSGKETRADLKVKADEIKEAAVKTADDVKDKATDVAEDVKAKAEDFAGRTGRAVEGAKKGFNSKK